MNIHLILLPRPKTNWKLDTNFLCFDISQVQISLSTSWYLYPCLLGILIKRTISFLSAEALLVLFWCTLV